MTTLSSVLEWRVPWTEEPGRLYSLWGHKESDTIEQLMLSLFFIPIKECIEKTPPFPPPYTHTARAPEGLCPSPKLAV